MRFLTRFQKWLVTTSKRARTRRRRIRDELARRCLFEAMEGRQLLAADPLFVGAVYIEEDFGSDDLGDTFVITFEGGAP